MLLVLLACAESERGSDGTGGEAVATVVSGDVTAACAATDNALRFDCSATFGTAAPVTWTVETGDGEVLRTFGSVEAETSDVTLWGLPPSSALVYRVRAGEAEAVGEISTGALPDDLGSLVVSVDGEAVDTDAVFVPETCGSTQYLLVIDESGEVVWYEAVDAAGLSGYRWTERETALYADGTSISELGADGIVDWTVSGFENPLHHDLERGGDRVYALYAHQVGERVVDGVYVLEDGEVVADWALEDHVTVTGAGQADGFWQQAFPGAEDWSHANSVWSDGSDLLLSLRWQDAVLKLDGDPASPTFGEVDWVLTGTDAEDVPGDFTWPDGGGFDGQHHASLVDGDVTVFDNGGAGVESRGVRIAVDRASATAREVGSWGMGAHCEVQGGVSLVGDSALVTCATSKTVSEFAPDASSPRFSMSVDCGAGPQGPGGATGWSRAMPVALR